MYVLLYDDLTQRAWLVDGASTVLHLLRLRLALVPYNDSSLFSLADFCCAGRYGGPEGSATGLLENRSHKIFEMQRERIDRLIASSSKEAARETETKSTF